MKNVRIRSLCRVALLAALALALSVLEGVFTPILPPGARAGLSNVVVMLAASALGLPSALAIVLCKALFALLVRGAVSFLLSLSGGVVSALLLWALFRFVRGLGTLGVSTLGALSHSLAQLAVSLLLYGSAVLAYAPVMILFSVPSGCITAALLSATAPLFFRKNNETKGTPS